jgi:hypothetical protein
MNEITDSDLIHRELKKIRNDLLMVKFSLWLTLVAFFFVLIRHYDLLS